MSIKAIKVRCVERIGDDVCNTEYIVFQERHRMFNCPKCSISGVDWDEHYCRGIGFTKLIEQFEPPNFDDEDEYHSCLLSWLNDSDEKYELEKPENILWIKRIT